ncbi:MAG: hypothetical protein KGJ13_02670 [Patescibacteria group bacterium]|nr:hypothetical protein [Patescibacteria group bacterium]
MPPDQHFARRMYPPAIPKFSFHFLFGKHPFQFLQTFPAGRQVETTKEYFFTSGNLRNGDKHKNLRCWLYTFISRQMQTCILQSCNMLTEKFFSLSEIREISNGFYRIGFRSDQLFLVPPVCRCIARFCSARRFFKEDGAMGIRICVSMHGIRRSGSELINLQNGPSLSRSMTAEEADGAV